MPHGRRPVTICLSSCSLDPQYPGPAAYTPAIIPDRGQPKETAYPRLLLLPQAQNRMPEPTVQLARSYVQVSAHVFLGLVKLLGVDHVHTVNARSAS